MIFFQFNNYVNPNWTRLTYTICKGTCAPVNSGSDSNNQIWRHTMVANAYSANYSIDATIKFINGMFMFCCWELRHKFHLALHLKLSNLKGKKECEARVRAHIVLHISKMDWCTHQAQKIDFDFSSFRAFIPSSIWIWFQKKGCQTRERAKWCWYTLMRSRVSIFSPSSWCGSKLISMIARPLMILCAYINGWGQDSCCYVSESITNWTINIECEMR